MACTMIRRSAIVLVVLVSACGNDDDGTGSAAPIFDPERAPELARAAMPEATDLPGEGWRVTAEDDFDDDEDLDFEKALDGEPACAEFRALEQLGTIFGGEDEDDTAFAGRAQRTFERESDEEIIPTSVEVELEIPEDLADTARQWAVMEPVFESDDFEACMMGAIERAFTQELDEAGSDAVTVEARDPASTPGSGAALGFEIGLSLAGFEVDMAMEMHFWPHGNGQVTTLVSGPVGEVDDALVSEVLATVDRKMAAAAT
jgi:hypothetical protein